MIHTLFFSQKSEGMGCTKSEVKSWSNLPGKTGSEKGKKTDRKNKGSKDSQVVYNTSKGQHLYRTLKFFKTF